MKVSYYYERPPVIGLPPRRAFTVSADAIKTLGGGDVAVGHTVLHDTLGGHVMDGPFIHPDAVCDIGHGDINVGHRVLRRFVQTLRHRSSP